MNNEVLLDGLAKFGLNNYEARVYSALFKKKKLSAAEVARLAGIPRTRAYDNLKSLELKGLCDVVTGKTKLYSAVNPIQLVEVLVKLEKDRTNSRIKKFQDEVKKEKNRLEEKIDDARDLAQNLIPLYENGRNNENSLDYVEVYKTAYPLHLKLIQLCTESQKEILLFVKPPFASRTEKQKMEAVNWQIEALNRGVKLRTIHEIPTDDEERDDFFKYLFDSHEPDKEDLRVIDYLPAKLMIFDESIVLFTLFDPMLGEASLTGFVAENEALAKSQKELFNLYWDKAHDPEMFKNKHNKSY